MLLNLYGSEAVRNKLKNRQKNARMGQTFDDYPGLQPKTTAREHMQCNTVYVVKKKISHVIRASAWNASNLLQQDDQTTKY